MEEDEFRSCADYAHKLILIQGLTYLFREQRFHPSALDIPLQEGDSQIMGRKFKLAVGVTIALLASAGLTMAFASSSEGGACAKAGQMTTVNGQKLKCSLVWVAMGSTTSAPSKTTSTAPAPSKVGIAQSKDFALISIQFSNDTFGTASASARIQNTGSRNHGAFFNITIFASDGKTPSVTLTGVADAVGPGETQTIEFFSTSGSIPTGQFTYAFQTSTEL